MGKIVVIGQKKYRVTGANDVIEHNTNQDLLNHFYGKDSIDAKWTRHIQGINQQLKDITEYKAGRPRKVVQPEQEPQF